MSKNELEFINYLNLNEKSKNTVEKYARDIRDFRIWCEENFDYRCNFDSNYNFEKINKENINKETLLLYKNFLRTKYNKISTINSKISSINTFLDFNKLQNLKIKIIKCQKSLFGDESRQLSKNDLNRLLNEAYKKNKRIYYLMLTIARTGIRVSEVKFITVESIKVGKAVVENKGKVRIIIIPKKLCKLLLDYCKICNIKSGSIFVTRNNKPLDRKNIWKEMKNLCDDAKVEKQKVFPHNLRHLFAKEFYNQTKDIVKLASIMGHSSIETTRIYTMVNEKEIVNEIERLRFDVERKLRE